MKACKDDTVLDTQVFCKSPKISFEWPLTNEHENGLTIGESRKDLQKKSMVLDPLEGPNG